MGSGSPVRGRARRRLMTFSWRRLAAAAGRGDAGDGGGVGRRRGLNFQSFESGRTKMQKQKTNVLSPRHQVVYYPPSSVKKTSYIMKRREYLTPLVLVCLSYQQHCRAKT